MDKNLYFHVVAETQAKYFLVSLGVASNGKYISLINDDGIKSMSGYIRTKIGDPSSLPSPKLMFEIFPMAPINGCRAIVTVGPDVNKNILVQNPPSNTNAKSLKDGELWNSEISLPEHSVA